jgi:hypothetical protein
VSENASPEVNHHGAAREQFCPDKTINSDIWGGYTSECTRAQWDYARSCN